MSMDFPASPTVGQSFAPGNGNQYVWDGVAWTAFNQASPAFIADTPPPNPAVGQLWWRGSNGKLYIYVDDGNSKQWVETGNAGATPGAWETIPVLDLVGVTQRIIPDLGAYRDLRCQWDFIGSATGAGSQVGMQFSTDNGATFISGASDYTTANMYVIQLPSETIGHSITAVSVIQMGLASTASQGCSGHTVISRFNKAAVSQAVTNIFYGTTTQGQVRIQDGSFCGQGLAFNCLKVVSLTGTITGRIILEGVRG